MKKYLHFSSAVVFGFILLALGALMSTNARAESTYGYASSGTGAVVATARVNLSVTVPRLILLKVGSSSTTIDTASWTVSASIPAVPTIPITTANGVSVNWNGAAPSLSVASPTTTSFAVSAWTNVGSSTVSCAVPTISPATGPAAADFAVTNTGGAGTLNHPGATLGACGATIAIPANSVNTGTWEYKLNGTPASWPAGVYTSVVTYTATGP